ncbi:S1/P1 nuclease [Flavobacterium qiangtangense]|uniref:S1/P1 nuclease n=1 Tax=Flavobacterium qiangtangense TaxID=1442595 RepID=A0ABW1PKG4_9FLAO
MKKILTGLLLLIVTSSSFAWGRKGHTMVAQIAYSYLDEATKNNINTYLDGMTLEEAANWMDDIKSDKKTAFMKPFHYANFPKGTKAADHDGGNIVSILNTAILDLSGKDKLTRDEIKTNLLFLFHLVGDLHQPLHVGYGNDKGGNTVQLNYKTRGTNLHSFWDTVIIHDQNISLSDCINAVKYSPEELQGIKKLNVVGWAQESRELLDTVYDYGNPKVSETYVTNSSKIVGKQLQKAGIRLASVLNMFFKT